MPDINERINSYQPLWGSWYNDAYIGGSSAAMLFRLRQDIDGERRYSAVTVIPAIYTSGLPETRFEREQFIDQQKALASREIKEMYSLRGKPYLVQCLADKQISITLTEAAKDAVIEQGFDPNYGARPLKRYIQSRIETLLARKMIGGEIFPDSTVTIDFDGSAYTLSSERNRQ